MLIFKSMKYICIICTTLLTISIVHSGCVKTNASASLDNIGVGNKKEEHQTSQDASNAKEANQTLNTGFMSGGAPWLFLVILAILHAKKHVKQKKEEKRANIAEIQIQELAEEVDLLRERNKNLRVQSYKNAVEGVPSVKAK